MVRPRIDFKYSKRNHNQGPQAGNQNQTPQNLQDSYKYNVRYVHQSHGNLCGDACLEMMFDFFSLAPINPTNLKLLQNTPPRLFEKDVIKYRTLPEDKRRDAAIAIFDRYISDRANPASSIRDHLIRRNQLGEVGRVEEIVEDGRLLKQRRDEQFGGFSLKKRWQRHKTKAEGYLATATTTLFDNLLLEVKQIASLEFINNPRGIAEGLTPEEDELLANNRSLSELGFECMDVPNGISAGLLEILLDQRGPIMTTRNIRVIGIKTGHWILVIGKRYVGNTLEFIYHDPFSGSNMAHDGVTLAAWMDHPADYIVMKRDDQLNQTYVRQRRI